MRADLFASATPKIICSHVKEKAEMSSLFVHEEDERVPLTSCVVYPGPSLEQAYFLNLHMDNRKIFCMTKMMITVVTVFMLSWLPLNTYILLSDLDPGVNNYEHIRYVYFIIHRLAMSHASYNPLIYCWMNAKFRDRFCQLFRRSKLCWPSRLRHQRPLRKESAAEVAALRRCNTYTTYVSVRAVPGSSYRFTKDAAQTNGKPKRYEDSRV
ncbi:hypothetical protein HPB51_015310 [Rhipicephalus microplus]|uniref:G-protein coupled receptors family 1 profile domain-containing protein n=1 Tax=Rhipicephalus microplus TaxID=6941 RepID=A0A9J6EI26_RHIMP|nr:hypothetical protein HPB51_015310 [Rhipicephalus microplus]